MDDDSREQRQESERGLKRLTRENETCRGPAKSERSRLKVAVV